MMSVFRESEQGSAGTSLPRALTYLLLTRPQSSQQSANIGLLLSIILDVQCTYMKACQSVHHCVPKQPTASLPKVFSLFFEVCCFFLKCVAFFLHEQRNFHCTFCLSIVLPFTLLYWHIHAYTLYYCIITICLTGWHNCS